MGSNQISNLRNKHEYNHQYKDNHITLHKNIINVIDIKHMGGIYYFRKIKPRKNASKVN